MRITLGCCGDGCILLNGIDISEYVVGFVIDSRLGSGVRVDLHFDSSQVEIDLTGAQVSLRKVHMT